MKIVAVDLDGTLRDERLNPIESVCRQINRAYESPDNFIVVYTARSYNCFHEVRDWLITNKVKHHAIVCEKLRASRYIDDKAERPII